MDTKNRLLIKKTSFSKPRYHHIISHLTIWSSLTYFLHADHSFAQNSQPQAGINAAEELQFTVNFNNTSVVEVIRFVSKITGTNFLFDETDLQFNVSIVSEEPTSTKNITSALVQILRIHGLKVLEQEGNILITSNVSPVSQIPTIVTEGSSPSLLTSPVVTRIFKIQNIQLADLVRVIEPMTSQASLVEAFAPSRQLIITDVATNVDKIATLIQSLDAPYSNLEIETYVAKNTSVDDIISTTRQILTPFANNNPLIFVPQSETKTIFIVSTSYLLELALTIMEDVDRAPGSAPPAQVQVRIYKPTTPSPDDLLAALQHIASTAPDNSLSLQEAISSAKIIPGTSSLMFVTDDKTWEQLHDLLDKVDADLTQQAAESAPAEAHIYKCMSSSSEALLQALNQLAANMPPESSAIQDAISSAKDIPGTNSLLFIANDDTWIALNSLLVKLDESLSAQSENIEQAHIYQCISDSPETLLKALHHIAQSGTLAPNNPQLAAISSAKSIPNTNSLLFVASSQTWTLLQHLLTKIDTGINNLPSAEEQAHIYQCLSGSPNALLRALNHIAGHMPPEDAAQQTAITSAKVIAGTASLLFVCDGKTWALLQQLLNKVDNSSSSLSAISGQAYVYQCLSGSSSAFLTALDHIANHMSSEDNSQYEAIASAKAIPGTTSVLFITDDQTWALLQPLLSKVDLGLSAQITQATSQSPILTQTYLYKCLSGPCQNLLNALDHVADHMPSDDVPLHDAIVSARVVPGTNSLFFYTDPSTWDSLHLLLVKLDDDLSHKLTEDIEIYVYAARSKTTELLLRDLQFAADQMPSSSAALQQAIHDAKPISNTSSLLFFTTPTTWTALQSLLSKIDSGINAIGPKRAYLYRPTVQSITDLLHSLQTLTVDLPPEGTPLELAIAGAKKSPDGTSLLFFTDEATWNLVDSFLRQLDVPGQEIIWTYSMKQEGVTDGSNILAQLSHTFSSPSLQKMIQSAQWVPDSRSFIFVGSQADINQLQTVIPLFDIASSAQNGHFLLYQVQSIPESLMETFLQELQGKIEDPNLIQAISSAKPVAKTNTILFHGTTATLKQLQNILSALDVPSSATSLQQLFLYTPVNLSSDSLQQSLVDMSGKLQDASLVQTILSMKPIQGANLIIFHGTDSAITKLQNILSSLDVSSPDQTSSKHFFIYTPVNQTGESLQLSLQELEQNLIRSGLQNQPLLLTLQSMKWVPSSRTLVFTGDKNSLDRIQLILTNFDAPLNSSGANPGFSLYKLQNIQGDIILNKLQNVAAHLPTTDPNNAAISAAIQSIKWIKDNNTLVLSGSPYAVEQVKALIIDFDTPALSSTGVSPKSDFFFYKPTVQTLEEMQTSVTNLAEDFAASGLADPDLIHTLKTVRLISASSSLLFTGTSTTLGKVQALLPSLDQKAGGAGTVQTVGNTTFLIYKSKKTPALSLIQSLQNFASQLSGSNPDDLALASCLRSAKPIQETNSLYFSGSQSVLQRAGQLAEQFDSSSTVSRDADTFVIYIPQAKTGTELISILYDFVQNLGASGVSDPSLFDAIEHLRFVQKTNSLIISGDPASISKVQDLLFKFDVPGSENGPSITAIASTNFLIYKLQYQQGIDIQTALKKVGGSLSRSAPEANKGLIDAIDSLQWIEVTNSLIGTGDPDILAKIKELILGLDIPLRQVFIEVLVVETSLFNSQNFGLQWGSQFQYLNKTVGAVGNFPSSVNPLSGSSSTQTGTLDLSNPISFATNTNTPVQGNALSSLTAVPFSTGFDLGVIGDIIFHKGQSFISLGSLMNALQVDNDTTIVMNPKIITQDGHTSRIFVGQNIPFVGSFISNTASNTVQSSNIEYRDVGVNLVITPTLGSNEIVTLDIQQDISEQTANSAQIQGSQVTGIQTTHTIMNTRVHVPDRHFLVLSGMIQDSKMHFRTGIPCLGGLPVIGALFSENDRQDSKFNVIIFLRPFIIDSFEEYDRLTESEEDLYKQQAGLQDLKEEFDGATEILKGLNND